MADDNIRSRYINKLESGELKARFIGCDKKYFCNFDLINEDGVVEATVQTDNTHHDVYIYDNIECIDYEFESEYGDADSDHWNDNLRSVVFNSFKEHDYEVMDIISNKDGSLTIDNFMALTGIKSRERLFETYDIVSDVYKKIADKKYRLEFYNSDVRVYNGDTDKVHREREITVIDPIERKKLFKLFKEIPSLEDSSLNDLPGKIGSINVDETPYHNSPVIGMFLYSGTSSKGGLSSRESDVIGSININGKKYDRYDLKSFVVDMLKRDDEIFAKSDFGKGDFPLDDAIIPAYDGLETYHKTFTRKNFALPDDCKVKVTFKDDSNLESDDDFELEND